MKSISSLILMGLLIGIAILSIACTASTTSPEVQDGFPAATTSSNSDVIEPAKPTGTNQPTTVNLAEQDKTLTTEEIAQGSIENSKNMSSFSFEMDYSMSFDLPVGEGTGTMSMEEKGIGLINLATRQMELDMNIVMEIPNEGRQASIATMYMTDGWLYMKTTVPGTGDQWTKMELTDDFWRVQNQLTNSIQLLESSTGINLTGSETIGGVDCYVIDINPDTGSVLNWAAGQNQFGQNSPNPGETITNETFSKLKVKDWIRKDNLLPAKTILDIAMNIPSNEPGAVTGNTMEISMTVTFFDYGKAVNIQLPPEALTATILNR